MVFADALPRTPSGKLQRFVLRQNARARRGKAPHFDPVNFE
jgi:acyl-coenzyme A synthetase/AMP-(fatty) acid ligase